MLIIAPRNYIRRRRERERSWNMLREGEKLVWGFLGTGDMRRGLVFKDRNPAFGALHRRRFGRIGTIYRIKWKLPLRKDAWVNLEKRRVCCCADPNSGSSLGPSVNILVKFVPPSQHCQTRPTQVKSNLSKKERRRNKNRLKYEKIRINFFLIMVVCWLALPAATLGTSLTSWVRCLFCYT